MRSCSGGEFAPIEPSLSGFFGPVFSWADADTLGRVVDNVCERAAMVGAERLLVRKAALDGVTVAVAAERWAARF